MSQTLSTYAQYGRKVEEALVFCTKQAELSSGGVWPPRVRALKVLIEAAQKGQCSRLESVRRGTFKDRETSNAVMGVLAVLDAACATHVAFSGTTFREALNACDAILAEEAVLKTKPARRSALRALVDDDEDEVMPPSLPRTAYGGSGSSPEEESAHRRAKLAMYIHSKMAPGVNSDAITLLVMLYDALDAKPCYVEDIDTVMQYMWKKLSPFDDGRITFQTLVWPEVERVLRTCRRRRDGK